MKTLSNLVRAPIVALSLALGTVTIAGPLAGCATFGVEKPVTFNEQMAAGYTGIKAAADLNSTLYDAKILTVEDARNVLSQLYLLKEGLDVARALRDAGDFTAADARLAATINALEVLKAYLVSRSGGEV